MSFRRVVPVAKTCSTADKSTKTDESLLESEERSRGTATTEAVSAQGSKQVGPRRNGSVLSKHECLTLRVLLVAAKCDCGVRSSETSAYHY